MQNTKNMENNNNPGTPADNQGLNARNWYDEPSQFMHPKIDMKKLVASLKSTSPNK